MFSVLAAPAQFSSYIVLVELDRLSVLLAVCDTLLAQCLTQRPHATRFGNSRRANRRQFIRRKKQITTSATTQFPDLNTLFAEEPAARGHVMQPQCVPCQGLCACGNCWLHVNVTPFNP